MSTQPIRNSAIKQKLHRFVAVLAGACLVSGGAIAATATSAAASTVGPINFETGYTNGSVNGQNGWSSTGPYDQEVVTNGGGAPASFGTKSFRISDKVTTGSFGDQTFTPATADAAGEPTATTGGFPTGTLQDNFSASFDIASTTPGGDQPAPGMHLSVSPDRGDGARMSYVRIEDAPGGNWNLFFDDYIDVAPLGSPGNEAAGCDVGDDFTDDLVATVSTSVPHNIRFVMKFVPGGHNDIVNVFLDGNLVASGTSWEDYFRYCEGGDQSRIVRNLLLREGGDLDDEPLNAGFGYLIDNLGLATANSCTTVCYVDDATGSDAASGQSGDPLKTIQAGVDTVTAGGTVNVAAGTYNEATTVPKAVTLNGANVGVAGTGTRGAESLVTRTSGQAGSAFNVTTANPVTIDGFNLQFQGSDQVGGLLNALTAGNKVTFKNNLVNNSSYVNDLLNTTSSATTVYTNNNFTGIAQTSSPGTGVVAAWGATPGGAKAAITFTGNSFTALTDNDGVPAINLNTVTGTVSNNTFQNIEQYGILLADEIGATTISGNLFDQIKNDTPMSSDNRGSGIRTFGQPTFTGIVNITGNTFSNSWHGVRIANDGSPATVNNNLRVNRNNILPNNIDKGLSADPATVGSLNGTCNWWGQASGPTAAQTEGPVTKTPFLRTSNLAAQCPAVVPSAVPSAGAVPYFDHGAKVVWAAPANNGGAAVDGYKVIPYRNGVAQTAIVYNSAARTQFIGGLTDGASYRFTITARNAVGFGPPSAQTLAMIAGAPGKPGTPTAVKTASGSLKLTFAAPMNNGAPITSYSATCTSSNGGVTKTATGSASPITVTGMTPNRSYTCTVKATNSRGIGPLSDPSAAKNA